MKNKTTLSSGIKVIDFTTFMLLIPTDNLRQIISSETKCMSYVENPQIDNKAQTVTGIFRAITLSEKNLKNQLVSEVLKGDYSQIEFFTHNKEQSFKDIFAHALEECSFKVMENFGLPDICIKLDKNTYIVGGPLDKDYIRLKLLPESLIGCLRVYTPERFKMFVINKG